MLTDKDLYYPVLRFWPDLVEVHLDSMSLGHTNALSLKNKNMVGIEVVDSRLRLLRILEAKKEHGVGRFRGYNLFFNQYVKARLILEVVAEAVEFKEVCERVESTVRNNRSMYECGGSVGELLAALAQVETFEELVSELS